MEFENVTTGRCSSPSSRQAMRQPSPVVIRDTARRPSEPGYFLIEGAPQCSVPDHQMKKELILNGLAWGHLPKWLIATELRDGALLSIAGRQMPGRSEQLAAVRRRSAKHGPVMAALWDRLGSVRPAIESGKA